MEERPITQILATLKSGDAKSFDELLPIVYDELRRLAGGQLSRERTGHTLQPTALVHEAYLRLFRESSPAFESRAHFFGIAARLMRQILIDHARGKNRKKRSATTKTLIAVDANSSFNERHELDILAVDEALTALAALDEKQAEIVEMKFFAGLTIEEIAEVTRLSPATVKREWATARLFLRGKLEG